MANTTIKIKSSGTLGSVPPALEAGEIAINYADGKIYYGNAATQTTLFDAVTEPSGLDSEVQYNSLGSFGSSSGFTYNSGTETLTITNLNSTTITNVSSRLSSSYAHANSAYDKANSANVLAQSAYTQANTGTTHAIAAYDRANTDVTSVSATGGTYGDSITIPSVTLLANGRVTSIGTNTVRSGTTSQTGVVQLTDSISSTSTTTAATPNSVKTAYDLANSKLNSSGGTISGNLVVTGNLSIHGDTTYLDVATIKVEDKNIELGNVATPTNITADGGGITLLGTTNKTFTWANSSGYWVSNVGIEAPSIKLASAYETSNTFTTSSTIQVAVDSFAVASYRSAKYFIQLTSGSSYHVLELNVVHDGTTVYISQFGDVKTGASLGTFDASISTGILNLLFTATNATTTVKLLRYNIVT